MSTKLQSEPNNIAGKVGFELAGKVDAPRPIHNYPVVPEKSRIPRNCPTLPLKRADLGADFRNALYFPYLNSNIARQAFYDARLGSATWTQWYGNVEDRCAQSDPAKKGASASDWKEIAALHAKHGLFVMFNSWAENKISKIHHDKMVKLFGPRFIGHDEGEWDGAYMHMVLASKTYTGRKRFNLSLSPRRSRHEACKHYLGWLGNTYKFHHHRMFTTSSLLLGCHYAGELGSRMLGIELGESLPCDTLMMSFLRGACKQYDLLMATFPSVFSVRGVKVYPRQGQPQSVAFEKSGYFVGPEHGTTLGLLKRHWWSSYMSGASIIGLQFGYFPTDLHSDNFETTHNSIPMVDPVTDLKVKAHFTPLGWLFWECKQTALRHPFRGVPYVPVAVMLHHDHGWYPQPNIYTGKKTDCVWGNIPYNSGDWQTDKFFQWVYPGYKLASADGEIRDERGKWVNTPFGDSFDVILSNAGNECLRKYRAVILLGSWDVASADKLSGRLEEFVRTGGTVISDSSQWTSLPKGVRREIPNESVAKSGLVESFQYGKGRIVMVSQAAWAADKRDNKMFETIKNALGEYLRGYDLLQMEGRPIYHLVNVTDNADELLITLCNNSPTLPWEGIVGVKNQEIVQVDEWLAYGETDIRDGALRCGVPANDVRIYRVKTRKPFLSLRFKNIPWRKLGFGAPEW